MAYSNYSINVPSCPSGSHSSGIVISILTYAFVACRVAKHPKKKTTPLLLHHHPPPPPPPPPPPRRRVLLPPTTTTTTATTTAGNSGLQEISILSSTSKTIYYKWRQFPLTTQEQTQKLRKAARRQLTGSEQGRGRGFGLGKPFQLPAPNPRRSASLKPYNSTACVLPNLETVCPTPYAPKTFSPKAQSPPP